MKAPRDSKFPGVIISGCSCESCRVDSGQDFIFCEMMSGTGVGVGTEVETVWSTVSLAGVTTVSSPHECVAALTSRRVVQRSLFWRNNVTARIIRPAIKTGIKMSFRMRIAMEGSVSDVRNRRFLAFGIVR